LNGWWLGEKIKKKKKRKKCIIKWRRISQPATHTVNCYQQVSLSLPFSRLQSERRAYENCVTMSAAAAAVSLFFFIDLHFRISSLFFPSSSYNYYCIVLDQLPCPPL
jgi:hypothetical protein